MPTPPTDATVRARWTLDASAWRRFVRVVRAYVQQTGFDGNCPTLSDDATEDERTIVVTDAAIHVGSHRFDLVHYGPPRIVEHASWIEFYCDGYDEPSALFPVPAPPGNRALATQVADQFRMLVEERRRQYHEVLTRPTRSNRLRWFVEQHFVAVLLVFFFVVLPLVSVLAAWIGTRLGADR